MIFPDDLLTRLTVSRKNRMGSLVLLDEPSSSLIVPGGHSLLLSPAESTKLSSDIARRFQCVARLRIRHGVVMEGSDLKSKANTGLFPRYMSNRSTFTFNAEERGDENRKIERLSSF